MGDGIDFENGQPYIAKKGLVYFWPDLESSLQFKEQREDLIPQLLEKIKEYSSTLNVGIDTDYYPYVQRGHNGDAAFHLGDGGRWLDIDHYFSGGMASCHNLDSVLEKMLSFNVASDVLEILGEKRAPKIRLENKYVVEFPLPYKFNSLPIEDSSYLNNQNVGRIINKIGFGEDVEISMSSGKQTIESKIGKIIFKNGLAKGEVSGMWDVPNVTFMMAILVNSCSKDLR